MNNTSPLADTTPSDAPALTPAFSPLYQQIKGLILQSLQSGEWKPGESIPSEMELAARYRVSQGTVRKAIDELASDNLLVRRQGKGTFVATHAEQHVQYRFLKLVPDQGDLNTEGPAQREIVDCKRLRASAEIARALGKHDLVTVKALQLSVSNGYESQYNGWDGSHFHTARIAAGKAASSATSAHI